MWLTLGTAEESSQHRQGSNIRPRTLHHPARALHLHRSTYSASEPTLPQEYTNYQFDCKPAALFGALERFAQFFVAPLCKADALEREVNAVDNEFTGSRSGP